MIDNNDTHTLVTTCELTESKTTFKQFQVLFSKLQNYACDKGQGVFLHHHYLASQLIDMTAQISIR